MSEKKQVVYDLLEKKGIEYEVVTHPPVYTIDEMVALDLPNMEWVAKNLFLRDDKRRQYYLVVVREEKRVALKEFRKLIGSRPLTFGSEEDLQTVLNLTKGAVTPFGILNDKEHKVKVYIDKSFENEIMGIHPNENTATVWLKTNDVVDMIKEQGNEIEYVEV